MAPACMTIMSFGPGVIAAANSTPMTGTKGLNGAA